MKIVIVQTQPLNPTLGGGVARITINLGEYFASKGNTVIFYSFDASNHAIPESANFYHSKENNFANNFKNIEHFFEMVSKERPNVIINQTPFERNLTKTIAEKKSIFNYVPIGSINNSLLATTNNPKESFKKILGSKFVFFNHKLGIKLLLFLFIQRHKIYLWEIINRHDKIVVPTPANLEELSSHFIKNFPREKFFPVPTSIPLNNNIETDKEKIILHVGRIVIEQKRSELLLKIWSNIYKALPDWKFIIVGDGPYLSTIEQQIAKEQIPRVSLAGFQDPELYYQKSSIFVMPSEYEGFPNVLLEAQKHGVVPVVFDSYLALKHILNDGKDGIMVKDFDTEKMAKEVIALAKNTGKFDSMSRNARNNVTRFSLENVGNQWLKVLNS